MYYYEKIEVRILHLFILTHQAYLPFPIQPSHPSLGFLSFEMTFLLPEHHLTVPSQFNFHLDKFRDDDYIGLVSVVQILLCLASEVGTLSWEVSSSCRLASCIFLQSS